MDLSSALPGIIGGIAAVFVMGWILKRVRSTPETAKDGSRVLRSPRIVEVIGWIGCGFFHVLLVASLLAAPGDIRLLCTIVFGGFSLLGLFQIWYTRRSMISYTEAEVRYLPLFARSFSFNWEAIVSAKYSNLAQGWVFRLADGRKVRVSIYMNGHKDFIETARRHLGIPIPDATMPAHLR